MKKSLELLGRYFILMRKVFTKPDRRSIFFKQFFTDVEKLVIDSIPIVAIISLFIGAVIVIQTASNIESPFIPKMYVGYMARESLVLEFCSTMIALILAGKVGSNISSEIGSMRISEQIDAMDMMGVNSANYLILPKIAASTVFNPLLMLFSFMLGLVGGAMIILFTGIVTMSQYVDGLHYAFRSYYIFYSMIKMSVFSFVITSISSFYGYNASGGALGVGSSSTKAIVVSSVMILVANLVITQLMLG
ncbi:putative phospholipid ABC transporter permease protein MlaE [bioreactor metagenome]|jgi:phospholipid/cholesterol/gamma-HCH transport system permease protein|uniref:Putative phospholipid ABC transporter permease protein MlaE n=1 Tax=bioreactor metagenome TaxID=1076179 RepID=A0A644V6E2_9ZZZZ|nr:ABC transporter permease [Bacteroidales bacterium]MBP8676960.1 ABC transporter permease [Bacteroidales bacterium]MBP9583973.1 ABC transporter permease [Bacteroidales bacterium]MBP9978239.1 ABC transporter permease [Bacteroidales bacterium]WRQ32096.1 ABC transporter permease [Bacteroidales bacterium MB20-C3-3]